MNYIIIRRVEEGRNKKLMFESAEKFQFHEVNLLYLPHYCGNIYWNWNSKTAYVINESDNRKHYFAS